ncbi:MAG: Dethiobiotin synthetase [Labilithrix sp.]|nr:Dethiobiotin synthetase [Labilithrix sp.]
MNAPLVVVTGTGTEIGKTHVSASLLTAWVRVLAEACLDVTVAGLKPVESGVVDGVAEDGRTLERLSTFHVKQFPAPYLLARPVSPHLAAREENRVLELTVIREYVASVRAAAGGVLVELAGGLFSPLGPRLTNVDVARDLGSDRVLLVAPDRLGVLHDVAATTRAAAAEGLSFGGIILVAPATPDASTGTNGAELSLVTDVPLLATLPRADVATLAQRPDITTIARSLVRVRG